MLLLITADNMLLMFSGWTGVGLCSYLLIGFQNDNRESATGARKMFIINRVGDVGLLLAIFVILYALHSHGLGLTLDFSELEAQQVHLGDDATVICLLLFVGAVAKSTQIPLYVWLPDASSAPTPASALIQTATTVTAGVYLLARMNFLFAQSDVAMTVVAGVGAATALYGAALGLVQNNIKRVLAYSTISQLGFMFMGVGVGAFTSGVFHVVTHALYKGALFLAAGAVIHAMRQEQDIRKMGGLWRAMPITTWTFLVATAACAGFPLMSGFCSTDEILWRAFSNTQTYIPGEVLWLVGVAAEMCTAFYMVRLLSLVFLGEARADERTFAHLREAPATLTGPAVVLAMLAAIVGLVALPHWTGVPSAFAAWLEPVFSHAAARMGFIENRELEFGLALLALALPAMAAFAAGQVYVRRLAIGPGLLRDRAAGIYRTLLNGDVLDDLYRAVIVRPLQGVARFCWRVIDDGLIDGGLVHGTAMVVGLAGRVSRRLADGNVQRYATVLFVGFWALVVFWLAI